MKTTLHSLDFGFLSSFHEKLFFPKFELLNSGCCLSASLYGIIIIIIIIIIIMIIMIIIIISSTVISGRLPARPITHTGRLLHTAKTKIKQITRTGG